MLGRVLTRKVFLSIDQGRAVTGCSRGFTLVELLITLVVLGVLAGACYPIIAVQIERSRAQEAVQQLDMVKGALENYQSFNGSYVGATYATINYDPNVVAGGQVALFSYAPMVVTAATYTVTAQREPAADHAGNTVVLNRTAAGVVTITRNGVYV